MNVYDLAHSLAREIKKSDEYKSYQEIRDRSGIIRQHWRC